MLLGEIVSAFVQTGLLLCCTHEQKSEKYIVSFLVCNYDSHLSHSNNTVSFCFSIVPGIFGSQQGQHLEIIKQMLQQSLTDQANPAVSNNQ